MQSAVSSQGSCTRSARCPARRTGHAAQPRPGARAYGMKERVAQLPPVPSSVKAIRIPAADNWTVENKEGSKVSFAIYYHLAEKHSNRLNRQAAETGLYLYDEVVEDAKQRPGAHKNIDLLLRVQEEGSDMEIVVDK